MVFLIVLVFVALCLFFAMKKIKNQNWVEEEYDADDPAMVAYDATCEFKKEVLLFENQDGSWTIEVDGKKVVGSTAREVFLRMKNENC